MDQAVDRDDTNLCPNIPMFMALENVQEQRFLSCGDLSEKLLSKDGA